MASLNMASINTLFRKGYLLAGVIVAANMFVVNEMKAMKKKLTTEEVINENNMETENHGQQKENQNDSGSPIKYASLLKSGLNFVLSWENTIITLLEERFSPLLTTILNGGIIIQEDIGTFELDV